MSYGFKHFPVNSPTESIIITYCISFHSSSSYYYYYYGDPGTFRRCLIPLTGAGTLHTCMLKDCVCGSVIQTSNPCAKDPLVTWSVTHFSCYL